MEGTIWVLTESFNDCDQHGQIFICAWTKKPSHEELKWVLTQAGEHPSDRLVDHVFNGGGRKNNDYVWFNLLEKISGKI